MAVLGLVELAKKDRRRVEDMLMDFVGDLHREGKAPNYIDNYLKVVRSWLNFNEVRLVRRIKIGNRNLTPTIANERDRRPNNWRSTGDADPGWKGYFREDSDNGSCETEFEQG